MANKVIEWADSGEKEIVVKEDITIERRVTLTNLENDLELAKQQVIRAQVNVDKIAAEIEEIKQALNV